MAQFRLWIWICGSLVFAAGVSMGFLAHRITDTRETGVDGVRLLPENTSFWLLRSRDVWEELEVDETQRQGLDAVLGPWQRLLFCAFRAQFLARPGG